MNILKYNYNLEFSIWIYLKIYFINWKLEYWIYFRMEFIKAEFSAAITQSLQCHMILQKLF